MFQVVARSQGVPVLAAPLTINNMATMQSPLTLLRAKPIITVHMLYKYKCCALQENVVSKERTLYDQETTDQYFVDCKVLTV